MSRRAFVAGAGAALAAPLAVGAQTPAQVFRIGVLGVGTPELGALLVDGLREAGYIEGRNVALEWRNPEGRSDRFDALAADLVRRDVVDPRGHTGAGPTSP